MKWEKLWKTQLFVRSKKKLHSRFLIWYLCETTRSSCASISARAMSTLPPYVGPPSASDTLPLHTRSCPSAIGRYTYFFGPHDGANCTDYPDGEIITTVEGCEAAARALPKADKTAETGNWNWKPVGCFYDNSSPEQLKLNSAGANKSASLRPTLRTDPPAARLTLTRGCVVT